MQCEILKKNKERQMEDEKKIMMIIPQKKTMLNNKIIRQQVQFSYGALGRRMTEASVNTDQGNGDEKVRRQSMKQEYAQTSDNFYDYIEETYLQWFY